MHVSNAGESGRHVKEPPLPSIQSEKLEGLRTACAINNEERGGVGEHVTDNGRTHDTDFKSRFPIEHLSFSYLSSTLEWCEWLSRYLNVIEDKKHKIISAREQRRLEGKEDQMQLLGWL